MVDYGGVGVMAKPRCRLSLGSTTPSQAQDHVRFVASPPSIRVLEIL
jgi:hypothetical protein